MDCDDICAHAYANANAYAYADELRLVLAVALLALEKINSSCVLVTAIVFVVIVDEMNVEFHYCQQSFANTPTFQENPSFAMVMNGNALCALATRTHLNFYATPQTVKLLVALCFKCVH